MKKLAILLFIASTNAFAQDYSQLITERQNTYEKIDEITEEAEFLIDGADSDWDILTNHGKLLVTYGEFLLNAFPAGSQAGSKAKTTIWTKPDKFNNLLMELNTGFKEFYQGAVAQESIQTEAGLEKAMDTCKNCHRSYRNRR